MENFISNLANAWTLIDLLIFAVLGLIIYLKNQENKSLSTELNYQEFQNSVLETKFKNEQVKVSQAQIEVERLKSTYEHWKKQKRNPDGTYAKQNVDPEIKTNLFECVKNDYPPHFTVGNKYVVSNIHTAKENTICLEDNDGVPCLVYKSAFKPVK